ncbi:pre-mycofactocin synthase MftD [Euzebya tangerina]|uniref:pre-mycofactocin synthase MftD n=1 Tax=Euzebya tangerina TaxID=591198 RepID=UPI000E31CA66|nr:pre-mycofactocin synthase MftD [Euzebya tangerina]
MAGEWFESVAVARKRARRILPSSVYRALIAGSEAGETLDDNTRAFRELGFAPLVASAQTSRQTGVTVLGQEIALPVIISPTGVQAVHPDGEVAVARAAAARGTLMSLSSFGSKPVEDVVEANPRTLFQLYWCGTREEILARIQRARAAGVVGLILTLDWSFSHGRDWGSPEIPSELDLKTMIGLAPQVALKPTYLARYARSGALPQLEVPNMVPRGHDAPVFFGAYGQWMQTPPPTWEDLAWLREQWEGPFVLKGIIRVDDAKRAVEAGFSAISVSNHGGNNIDGTPASIRALPAITAAVGSEIEVLLDGGIRRGSDVIKALALGADAVLIGRAYLWGLAANGQAGVENVLDVLAGGIDSAMRALGKAHVDELTPADVLVPEGFTRELGAS